MAENLCPYSTGALEENGTAPSGDFSVLVLDDDAHSCRVMQDILEEEGYRVRAMTQSLEALRWLISEIPDLMIVDFFMPGMNGLEFLVQARELAPEASRILCTGQTNFQVALDAINKGKVNRFITKPFDPDALLAAAKECLSVARLRAENARLLQLTAMQNEKLSEWNKALGDEVASRTQHLERLTEASIFALAELAESRAQDIGSHLRRMQTFARLLAETLMRKGQSPSHLTDGYLRDLELSTLLHDIGKVGIPDGILFKPGKLTAEEFLVMKKHTDIGQHTIRSAQNHIGDRSFLSLGIAVAGHHHERWDGKGYPAGYAGEEIPFAARVVAIADVYDALTSQRVYKAAWPHAEAIDYIRQGAGTQFDPQLCDILQDVAHEFEKLSNQSKKSNENERR